MQAQKLLPEIMANPTADGGAQILKKIGVDSAFVRSAFDKYGSYGTKLGLSKGTIATAVDNLGKALEKGGLPTKPAGVDMKNYPRV